VVPAADAARARSSEFRRPRSRWTRDNSRRHQADHRLGRLHVSTSRGPQVSGCWTPMIFAPVSTATVSLVRVMDFRRACPSQDPQRSPASLRNSGRRQRRERSRQQPPFGARRLFASSIWYSETDESPSGGGGTVDGRPATAARCSSEPSKNVGSVRMEIRRGGRPPHIRGAMAYRVVVCRAETTAVTAIDDACTRRWTLSLSRLARGVERSARRGHPSGEPANPFPEGRQRLRACSRTGHESGRVAATIVPSRSAVHASTPSENSLGGRDGDEGYPVCGPGRPRDSIARDALTRTFINRPANFFARQSGAPPRR